METSNINSLRHPLLLVFVLALFLMLHQVRFFIEGLMDVGVNVFLIAGIRRYAACFWALCFIFLYCKRRPFAWHLSFVPVLAFLQYVLFVKTPHNLSMEQSQYRGSGLFIAAIALYYIFSKYRLYMIYCVNGNISSPDYEEYETYFSDDPVNTAYKMEQHNLSGCLNPLYSVFSIVKIIFIIDSIAILASIASTKFPVFSIQNSGWLFSAIFIFLYKRSSRFACDVLIISCLSAFIRTILYETETDNQTTMAMFKAAMCLGQIWIIWYLLKKRKQYQAFIAASSECKDNFNVERL